MRFHLTCVRLFLQVLQAEDIAYKPASNKSRTWIEAAAKNWKIAH